MTVAPAALFGLPEWGARLALAGIVLAAATVLLWLIAWALPHALQRAGSARNRARARQRQTAVSALATGLRYALLVAAAIAVAFALAGGGGLAAVGSGALVVVVVGFASQRLLVDLIAGFFVLFDDQYGVGDTVRLEPSGYTGRVVELGLRSTVLEGPGGERMFVPNGQVSAARVLPSGRRTWRVEILTADPDAAERLVHATAGAVAGAGGPWDGPPRVVRRAAAGDGGLVRVIALVAVDPSRESAASEWLPAALAAGGGDVLAAPPLAVPEP
mgnify:CR=1 FL=1